MADPLGVIEEALVEHVRGGRLAESLDAVIAVQGRLRVLTKVVEVAAGMPDDDEMPEWARELRHHAREAMRMCPACSQGKLYPIEPCACDDQDALTMWVCDSCGESSRVTV